MFFFPSIWSLFSSTNPFNIDRSHTNLWPHKIRWVYKLLLAIFLFDRFRVGTITNDGGMMMMMRKIILITWIFIFIVLLIYRIDPMWWSKNEQNAFGSVLAFDMVLRLPSLILCTILRKTSNFFYRQIAPRIFLLQFDKNVWIFGLNLLVLAICSSNSFRLICQNYNFCPVHILMAGFPAAAQK